MSAGCSGRNGRLNVKLICGDLDNCRSWWIKARIEEVLGLDRFSPDPFDVSQMRKQ